MIISYDFGHMEGGQDGSASGFLYEYKVNREYGKVCVDRLIQAGHTLINCTPKDGSLHGLDESLSYRCAKANSSGSQLHLCFHANCFDDPAANGTEVEVGSDKAEIYGKAIVDNLAKLGYRNRGVNRPNLYMTRCTNMPCVLTEVFFVSNKADCDRYNPVNIGNAIADGVLSIIGQSRQETPTTPERCYIVTNYLPQTEYGVEIMGAIKLLEGIDRLYLKEDDKGKWFETQWLTIEQGEEYKIKLGDLFYSIMY